MNELRAVQQSTINDLGDTMLMRANAVYGHGDRSQGWETARYLAEGIVVDPQAHIDALVEARVLGESKFAHGYYVVQPQPPHEHSWFVHHIRDDRAFLNCSDSVCEAISITPNRLPIEIPS